jgi:hypothetical protein
MRIESTICQVRADLRVGALTEARLRKPDLRQALMQAFSLSEQEISDEDVDLRSVLSEGAFEKLKRRVGIQLQDGLFVVEGEREVTIEDLSISPNSLYVRAQAPTEVCSQILKQAVQIVGEYTKLTNLMDSIESYSYATESKVILHFPFESLLSKPLRETIFGDLQKAVQGEDRDVEIHPFDVDFKVHLRLKGRQRDPESGNFRIHHEQYRDYADRRYSVYSRLESSVHFSLIKSLEDKISGS